MAEQLDFSALAKRKAKKERQAVRPEPKKKEPGEGAELKPAMFRIKPVAKKQFAILATELDMKQQELIAEAMNLVFEKYEKAPIA